MIAVTLAHASTNYDIGKGLISDGFVHVQKHRDRRLTKLVSLFYHQIAVSLLSTIANGRMIMYRLLSLSHTVHVVAVLYM